MNYQTFEPAIELAPFVKCYWALEGTKEELHERQRIVPDGCMEMIFHYGDLYRQYTENGQSILQPRCFVIGQISRLLEVEPSGVTAIFSVRFHPDGFLPFSPVPIREMDDKAIALEKLFAQEGIELEQQMLRSMDNEERIKVVEAFLRSRLEEAKTIDRIIKSAVETIVTANGQLSVNELLDKVNIKRRNLERKFATAVGLSPKQLARIIRLQATARLLLNKQFTSLTALAYEGSYYDQAHFIKDFKEFTGQTPGEFYGDDLKLSSAFYTGD